MTMMSNKMTEISMKYLGEIMRSDTVMIKCDICQDNIVEIEIETLDELHFCEECNESFDKPIDEFWNRIDIPLIQEK